VQPDKLLLSIYAGRSFICAAVRNSLSNSLKDTLLCPASVCFQESPIDTALSSESH